MFSLWGVENGCMTGYVDAVKVWESKPTWKGETDECDRRSIRMASRKRRYLTVRKCADKSIAFEYHQTDVVRYMPDNSVIIKPWSSISTDTFMRGCAPVGMHSQFSNENYNLLKCSEGWDGGSHWSSLGSIWDITDGARFTRAESGTWIPDEGSTKAFDQPWVNRKKAREALKKYAYKDLGLWLNAATQLGVKPKIDYSTYWSPRKIVSTLEAREWAPFLAFTGWRTNGNNTLRTQMHKEDNETWRTKILTGVRHAIYEVEGAVEIEPVPFLNTWEQVKSMRQLQQTYAWL